MEIKIVDNRVSEWHNCIMTNGTLEILIVVAAFGVAVLLVYKTNPERRHWNKDFQYNESWNYSEYAYNENVKTWYEKRRE